MILDFGYVCMNFDTFLSSKLDVGSSLHAKNTTLQIGGAAALQSITAARCGARVSLLGSIGDDIFGEKILETLRREGIIHSGIIKSSQPTGFVQHIRNNKNITTTITSSGAHLDISPEQICSTTFHERHILLLHSEVSLDFNITLIEMAKNKNMRVFMSFSDDTVIDDSLINILDIAFIVKGDDHHTAKPLLKQVIAIDPVGFDCYCGSYAACIQAGMTHERAQDYAISAQNLYQHNANSGYAAIPYLNDIEKNLEKKQSKQA